MGVQLSEALAVVVAVARRPTLWRVALVQMWRLRRPGWWRRPPLLPVPDPDYLRFRRLTAYGTPDHPLDPVDVVQWLRWCASWPHVAGHAHDPGRSRHRIRTTAVGAQG